MRIILVFAALGMAFMVTNGMTFHDGSAFNAAWREFNATVALSLVFHDYLSRHLARREPRQ